MIQREIASFESLKQQVEGWVRGHLWAQVLAGLVLGILVGYLLGPDVGWVAPETSEAVGSC